MKKRRMLKAKMSTLRKGVEAEGEEPAQSRRWKTKGLLRKQPAATAPANSSHSLSAGWWQNDRASRRPRRCHSPRNAAQAAPSSVRRQ